MLLDISKIKIDGGTQSRERLDESVVSEYAEVITLLPPIVVFFDGSEHWLADGFHRYHAHRSAGRDSIESDIRSGTRRDAVLYSVGANREHGLRRSNADKRRAVNTLLADSEWAKWSDRRIAEACGVSHPFVAATRTPEAASRQAENRAVSETRRVAKQVAHGEVSLPKAVAKVEAKAGKPAARPAAKPEPQAANDDHDAGIDLHEIVDELQAENTRLTGLLLAAEADDLKAEALKWKRCYDNAVRQQSEAMDKAHRAEKREAWNKKQLMRCGKAVGEEDPIKIAKAVEAMARQAVAA